MKEFVSYNGGRTAFNEDLENLRDLALSFSHFFDDAGLSFVISGCNISRNGTEATIDKGYVYMDGKIRKFDGAGPVYYGNALYIVPKDTKGRSIIYNNKNISGQMSMNYGTELSLSKPSSGSYIDLKAMYRQTLSSFFSHYALSKELYFQTADGQIVDSSMDATGEVTALTLRVIEPNTRSSASIRISDEGGIILSLYDRYGAMQRQYTIANGEFSSIDKNGMEDFHFPDGRNNKLYLPSVSSKEVNCTNLVSNNVEVAGTTLADILREDGNISGWYPMLMGGEVAPDIYVKKTFNQVYICGLLRLFLLQASRGYIDGKCSTYITNISLPATMPLPREQTYFQVMCATEENTNLCIQCFFGEDRIMRFKGARIEGLTTTPEFVNWHYQI